MHDLVPMHDLVRRLGSDFHLEVLEKMDAAIVMVPKSEGLTFEITIPHRVLEWFAVAKNADGQVWSDWADYYATKGELPEALHSERASDIWSFLNNLLTAEVRVIELAGPLKSEFQLAWKQNETWRKISLCAA